MSMLSMFGIGFFITMGVEVALGLCFAIGAIFKGAGKDDKR